MAGGGVGVRMKQPSASEWGAGSGSAHGTGLGRATIQHHRRVIALHALGKQCACLDESDTMAAQSNTTHTCSTTTPARRH
jgi:hypothetical protein